MIIIRHSEECAGKPNGAGYLTGKCNCQTAKLDETARKQLEHVLRKLAEKSILAGEGSEYFALRLEALAEQITKDAQNVRCTAARQRDIAARKRREETNTTQRGCK